MAERVTEDTTRPPVEREIKLRFASVDEARRAIIGAGANPVRRRRLQEDTLLDTTEGALGRGGSALRVRLDDGESFVTFKGPVQPGMMKVREELEVGVGDGHAMLALLDRLGFRPSFRYQKFREEFAAPGVLVALDETAVGVFVELEGDAQGIAALATALGRSERDYIRESYRSLFEAHRRAPGLQGPNTVFEQP